ncbi:hypothetical protein [Streptomyces sparsogenes]|uniref:Uncharacterized protein n=1 Tax=Streptomyces sparsogenes DSM 40356 TaxID=1331668 RepID=A0A1R1SPP2_9ACTN|nr:hypothetical protein [Streptomyces sparsogenes]OMI40280.1 hypothetical protein SPAR_06880 [Streptomyces sparsogenes DSM 40356]
MADITDATELTESEESDLRVALRMIAEEAGRADLPPEPAPRPVRRRRATVRGVLATAAALAVGVLTIGVLTFVSTDGRSATSAGGADGQGLTGVETVACARFAVEGEVVAVRDASRPHQVVVTLAVRGWIKPAQGAKEVDINTVDPEWLEEKPFRTGERLVLVDMGRPDGEVVADRGTHVKMVRELFKRELPKAAKTECPAFWRDQDAGSNTPPDS